MLLSTAFSLFIAGSSALANDYVFKRQVCNKDNCLRLVQATDSTGASTKGVNDCSAYLIATIAPCAITATATVTTTLLASSTTTSTVVVPNTRAGVTTVKVTQFLTSSRVSTIVATVPATVISTVTSTITVTASASVKAKRANARPLALAVKVRQADVCSTTATPVIPTSYSLCSGSVRFTSACACAGVTSSTVTLTTAPTSTMTITATASSVVVSTKVVTTTSGFPNYSTYTSIASISISTIYVNVTSTSGVATTSTTTVFATVTASSGGSASSSSSASPSASPSSGGSGSGSGNASLRGPSCNAVDKGPAGLGGCNSSCYCDERAGLDNTGVCNNNNNGYCGVDCNSDADCPTGSACAGGDFIMSGCLKNTCVAFDSCSSTFSA